MKTSIFLSLWVAVVASCLTVRAHDNPAQAAARAALEQKLNELDQPHSQPAPTLPAGAKLERPRQTATNTTNPVPAKAVMPHPAPVTTASAPVAPPPLAAAAPTASTPTLVRAPTQATRPPVQPKPTNEIVTIYGTVYKNAQVEKVEPDGIIISYWTAAGGLAMSKVYFEDLPHELRQQYQKK